MNISDVIEQLQDLKEQRGDLGVYINRDYGIEALELVDCLKATNEDDEEPEEEWIVMLV